ncbi:DnaJ domain-containing protein [Candidatus Pacearchaeota archaeon]|nr:DnaJ domain-containing protein [Candidatus Pacearchaeota archaeon]
MTHAEAWKELGLDGKIKMIDLKNVYRKLAKECHPDKGGTVVAFKRLKTAYDLLVQAFTEKRRHMTQVRQAPQEYQWVQWVQYTGSTANVYYG